ncbi:hypothetical protein OG935_05470 [Nocardia cyriacigeorgica]|nr:hypothetical protein [Nocardia cyriacigeorgica]
MTQPAETEAAWCRLAGLAEVYIDLAMGLDRRSIYLTDPQP